MLLYLILSFSFINTLAGESMHPVPLTDLKNWNCAISYGMGSTSPLSPSFNFSLELVRNTQVSHYCSHYLITELHIVCTILQLLGYFDKIIEIACF